MTTKIRMTKARKAIVEIFEKAYAPLTALEVNNRIKVNKTTVYRELEFLVAHDFLCEVSFGDGKQRFEKRGDHHHHLVCDACGKIQEIKLNEEDIFSGLNTNNFEITRHNLEFFGLCQGCQ